MSPESIHGFYDYANVYQELVDRAQPYDLIVEIGSLLGKSACDLALRIRKSEKKGVLVVCVDTWPYCYQSEGSKLVIENPYGIFLANIVQCRVQDLIQPIRATSIQAARIVRNQLASVFIDGCHEYASVKADIEAWLPKVKSGGILAGHDFSGTYPGVTRAVKEKFGDHLRYRGQCWIHDKP